MEKISVPHVHVGWNKAVDLNKRKVYFKNRFLGKHCFIGASTMKRVCTQPLYRLVYSPLKNTKRQLHIKRFFLQRRIQL